MQRDHLFNRSTRPLLEPRSQHPVQVKKKSSTDYKLHGFNDFNFVANQYKHFNNTHTGYPYGSPPPSPTQHQCATNSDYTDSLGNNSNDFIFSDDSGIHISNTSNFSNQSSLPAVTTNYYDDVINNSSNSNDYNYHTPIEHRKNYKKGFFKGWTSQSTTPKKIATVAPTTINQLNGGGPFIFGVHSNSCYTLPKVNNESVINSSATAATTKYSAIDENHSKNDDVSTNFTKTNLFIFNLLFFFFIYFCTQLISTCLSFDRSSFMVMVNATIYVHVHTIGECRCFVLLFKYERIKCTLKIIQFCLFYALFLFPIASHVNSRDISFFDSLNGNGRYHISSIR